ncbi:hypothetical protein Tco_1570330 [Tanacetum coccineum]
MPDVSPYMKFQPVYYGACRKMPQACFFFVSAYFGQFHWPVSFSDADVTRVIMVLYVTLRKHLWCGNDEDEHCVRIMEKSQENRTNTDTRRKRVYKSQENAIKAKAFCMRTRRSNYPNNSNVIIPRRRRRQVSNIVEPEIRTIVAPMAERTMEELLRAPTEGYREAIVLPEINADHFEIKTNLLQLVQANPFNGRENENPHAHINSFKRITSTLRFRNVIRDYIECKDSYDSNLDESTFLVTHLSDSNKDECLTPEDDIEILLHHDPSTPLKSVASILEGFINDPPFEENDDLFALECKTNDEAEYFDPGGNNDEIDAFLAIEVPTYIEEGYYDSEGDVLYLESLLNDDTTHNLSPDVFFDHKPQHIENESDHVTFSPKSDPLHHEFTGELITIPPGIVREHEDYINRMSLLCGNSSSRSPENFHTIIESLPTSTTLVEDSDSNREEIDIFSGPDDSIPPGIESDFDSEEDIIDNLLNDDPIHERLTFDMEPDVPVINNVDELNEDECFDPGGGEINVEVDNSFTFVTRTFLPYLTYPEVSPLLSSTKNEDTIFDPDIST